MSPPNRRGRPRRRGAPGLRPPRPERDAPDDFAAQCAQAVRTAALDLGLEPDALAGELAHGEIGLLISYLREAAEHVEDVRLRTRIDALLHRLTTWTRRDDRD